MGLDVNLVRFRNFDSEAVLKFARFSNAPWVFKGGPDVGAKLKAGARDFGLPESIIGQPCFGGEAISFPSNKHGQWPRVGEWSSFSTTCEFMEHFTRKDIYFVFPGARANPGYLRPDWARSKQRLVDILARLQQLKPAQLEDYHSRSVLSGIHPLLREKIQKMDPAKLAGPADIGARHLAQIEVMIETLDYVLNHESPREFLLRWSA